MMNIPWCPVVTPTQKEFKNFYQYVEQLDRLYKKDYGMVKVIPPPGWKAREAGYGSCIDNMLIPGPIEQNTYGKGGIYECLHIQKKSLTYKEYRKKILSFDKISEGKSAEEVEDLFWKNIAFSPPLYGADIQMSLMGSSAGSWNLSNLESVLTYALEAPIKGVNTPYCYVGSWKTLFCWHTEDLELSAINYLHDGKSKFWYSIPQNQHHILEKEANKLFGDQFAKCSEYLRHKTTVINPYILKQKYPELKISKMEHRAGEFILVFGGAYHCGFNFGFNLAEAVNYATLGWLKQLIGCKSCKCANDSVKVLNNAVYDNLSKSILRNAKEVQDLRKDL